MDTLGGNRSRRGRGSSSSFGIHPVGFQRASGGTPEKGPVGEGGDLQPPPRLSGPRGIKARGCLCLWAYPQDFQEGGAGGESRGSVQCLRPTDTKLRETSV